MKKGFWLRWAWRDLRLRWLQVTAIALIIATGTGIYAGLGGQEAWRIASMNKSYEKLWLHDLRVSLTPGSFVPREEAMKVLEELEGVAMVEPRLIMDTMVDASTMEKTIIVKGRVVGVDTTRNGPLIDRIYIDDGRALNKEDNHFAIIETKFASYYGLETGNRLTLIGDVELDVVGIGQSPEYFQIIPDQSGFAFRGESSLAVIFVPLTKVQSIYERPGLVNDLRIRMADGSDPETVRAAVVSRLASEFPGVSAFITYGEDDPVRVFLYADAEEDQDMFNLMAFFLLFGAALAAFNLTGRIVESQRRQIGIGMALGMPRHRLAIRPLLVGLQIALLGTLFGLPLGFGFTRIFGGVIEEFMPLPYWAGTLLDPPSFLLAAGLGIIIPLLATLIPVWQAVRANPLEALHGHLTAKNSGLNRWLRGLRLPGTSFYQMPLKNILRSPKRTVLTILGLALAMALLFVFLGLLDTFSRTLDQTERAFLYQSHDRIIVTLDFFYPIDHKHVNELVMLTDSDEQPLFKEAEPGLMLTGQLRSGAEMIETLVQFYSTDSAIWMPALLEGHHSYQGDQAGIVISNKAANDLGVAIGDTLIIEHPYREDVFSFRNVSTKVTVAGIHDNPVRGFSYVSLEETAFTGLEGLTNVLTVTPSPGASLAQIQNELFAYPVISGVDEVAELTAGFHEILDIFIQMLRIMQGGVLFIAFLIAFNSTSINIDDRLREVATMFAFGMRPLRVTWVQIGENAILGVLGAAVGGWLGWVLLNKLMVARMETMLEEIDLLVTITPLSVLLAVGLGIGIVALTPLLSVRRLQRIDVPSTLRVME